MRWGFPLAAAATAVAAVLVLTQAVQFAGGPGTPETGAPIVLQEADPGSTAPPGADPQPARTVGPAEPGPSPGSSGDPSQQSTPVVVGSPAPPDPTGPARVPVPVCPADDDDDDDRDDDPDDDLDTEDCDGDDDRTGGDRERGDDG